MMTLLLLLVFLGVGAAIWFQGAWNGLVTLINLVLAAMVATNYYEPICDLIESSGGASFTYVLDFVVLWILFAVVFLIFRTISDLVSPTRVKFEFPVEMGVRSFAAVWCAWMVVCFFTFSLQLAPLNSASPLGAWTTLGEGSFLGIAPDKLWVSFMQNRSMNALSRGKFSTKPNHPQNGDRSVEAFDPQDNWLGYQKFRRERYEKITDMRVNR